MTFQRLSLSGIVALGVAAAPVSAAFISPLTITPTFEASITGDMNAAAIEATINQAIGFYTNNLTTATAGPIDVTIDFQEGGGLGGSLTSFYGAGYVGSGLHDQLIAASSGDATDTAALAGLPAGDPISGQDTLAVTSANLRALGYIAPGGVNGTFDGQITLNTTLTTPGSPTSSGQYSLLAVTEHEIDEVLGLGSDEGGAGSGPPLFNDPRMEDLFRYTSGGVRAWHQSTTCVDGNGPVAFFSLDGTTPLSYFNNCNNGGDYGDWYSATGDWPGFGVQVQDAYATPGSTPSLTRTSSEVVALDAIGYNLAAPEPGTMALLFGGIAALGYYRRRRA